MVGVYSYMRVICPGSCRKCQMSVVLRHDLYITILAYCRTVLCYVYYSCGHNSISTINVFRRTWKVCVHFRNVRPIAITWKAFILHTFTV